LHLFTFPLMGMDKHKVIIYILGFHFKVKRGLEMIHPDDGMKQPHHFSLSKILRSLKVTNLLDPHDGIL
jgi:hypothetical protein